MMIRSDIFNKIKPLFHLFLVKTTLFKVAKLSQFSIYKARD